MILTLIKLNHEMNLSSPELKMMKHFTYFPFTFRKHFELWSNCTVDSKVWWLYPGLPWKETKYQNKNIKISKVSKYRTLLHLHNRLQSPMSQPGVPLNAARSRPHGVSWYCHVCSGNCVTWIFVTEVQGVPKKCAHCFLTITPKKKGLW